MKELDIKKISSHRLLQELTGGTQMKQDEVRQTCPPKIRPLNSEEQKKMDKIFNAMFKEDDCRD